MTFGQHSTDWSCGNNSLEEREIPTMRIRYIQYKRGRNCVASEFMTNCLVFHVNAFQICTLSITLWKCVNKCRSHIIYSPAPLYSLERLKPTQQCQQQQQRGLHTLQWSHTCLFISCEVDGQTLPPTYRPATNKELLRDGRRAASHPWHNE